MKMISTQHARNLSRICPERAEIIPGTCANHARILPERERERESVCQEGALKQVVAKKKQI